MSVDGVMIDGGEEHARFSNRTDDAMTKANKYMKSKYAMPNDNFTTE